MFKGNVKYTTVSLYGTGKYKVNFFKSLEAMQHFAERQIAKDRKATVEVYEGFGCEGVLFGIYHA